MSIRIDNTADRLYRTANLPSEQLFSVCGWFQLTSNLGAVVQPIFTLNNAALTDAVGLVWEDSTGAMELLVTTGGVNGGSNFASRPAAGEWFFWYVRCDGATIDAGWSGLTDSGFVTATRATHVGFTESDIQFGGVSGLIYTDCRQQHIRCWDAALTDAEFLLEKYSTLPVRQTSLNFAWRDISASSVTDLSPNGRSATIAGTLTLEADPPIDDLLHPEDVDSNYVPTFAVGAVSLGATYSGTNTTTVTIPSVVLAAGDVADVTVQARNGSDETVSSVTFNGSSTGVTHITTSQSASGRVLLAKYRIMGVTGTASVVITMSGGCLVRGVVQILKGVDLANPVISTDTDVDLGSESGALSSTVTLAAGDMAVAAVVTGPGESSPSMQMNIGQTWITSPVMIGATRDATGAVSYETGVGSITSGYTWNGADGGYARHTLVAYKAAAGWPHRNKIYGWARF